jgi:outer membrane protein
VAALRPVINYVGQVARTESPRVSGTTGSLALSADWLLYDFGATRLRTDAQKETVLATREALRGVEQDVLLRAVAAFLNIRRQNAFVALQDNNVSVITQQVRAARDRFEVGEVTRTDVSIAEARLAAAQSALAASQGALAQAREEYKAVTGAYPGRLSAPPPAPATASALPGARAIALERHPRIIQAQHQVRATELVVSATSAGLRPRLSANAQVSVDDNGDDTESVGLSLSGPIYQGGQIASSIRQGQAQRDAARAGLYLAVQNTEQEVGNAWADLAVARATQAASVQQVTAARLALRGGQQELEVGSRTTLDVLDLEQELLDAQANQISAEVDSILATYALLSSMGLLTVDHLGLGIATYDPAAYYNAVKSAPTVFVSPQGEKLDKVLRSLNRE